MSWHHLLALLTQSPSATRSASRILGTTKTALPSRVLSSTNATIILPCFAGQPPRPHACGRGRNICFLAPLAADVPRVRAKLELDKSARLDDHRCRAWGVHAVGRVRRARGCAREMRVTTGWCPCSGGPKADCPLDGCDNHFHMKTSHMSRQRLGDCCGVRVHQPA